MVWCSARSESGINYPGDNVERRNGKGEGGVGCSRGILEEHYLAGVMGESKIRGNTIRTLRCAQTKKRYHAKKTT